jgi:hypothetical protein
MNVEELNKFMQAISNLRKHPEPDPAKRKKQLSDLYNMAMELGKQPELKGQVEVFLELIESFPEFEEPKDV